MEHTALRKLIQEARAYVEQKFQGEATGHDWYHIERVTHQAIKLAALEGADMNIAELGALMHDVGDHKFLQPGEAEGPEQVRQWLKAHDASDEVIERVVTIVANVSYKGAGVETAMATIEGKVVQDADRLDAVGAIGIARTFAYGGHKGNPIHDPFIVPEKHGSFENYKKAGGTTINHFYEKLLLLKDRMQTESGRRIAEQRHQFMENYLEQFYEEWEGDR